MGKEMKRGFQSHSQPIGRSQTFFIEKQSDLGAEERVPKKKIASQEKEIAEVLAEASDAACGCRGRLKKTKRRKVNESGVGRNKKETPTG